MITKQLSRFRFAKLLISTLYEREDMSRSRKKNPIHGITTSDSEKEDKRIANRKERRINKQLLDSTNDDTKLVQNVK